MSVGLGVDIVEIERMRRILDRTPSFAHKVFTDAEQDYCNRKGNPATHYAARFAAKEAVCKALGTGILASGIGMRDVEVVRASHGKPAIALHGAAARIAEEQGVVAQGKLNEAGVFVASEVLAKHDENYMPPEAAKALEDAHKAGVAKAHAQGMDSKSHAEAVKSGASMPANHP